MKFLIVILLAFSWLKPEVSLAGTAPTPKRGGTLRFGIDSDVLSLNPFQRTLSTTKHVGSVAFECLLTVDKNEEIKPALATAWDVSKDGLQYMFRLRKGVKFHNGKDMTVEDVIWSIEYAKDPKNGAYGRDKLQPIAAMTASDPLTLQIVLKEPYVPFLASVSTGFDAFPVVPKGSVPFGRERVTVYPPGTGPFAIAEYRPGQMLHFKRFDQYWQKGIPYLDAIQFRPIDDPTVRFTAIRTGELDVAARIGYEQGLRVLKGEFKDLGLEFNRNTGYRALIFNTEKSPFDDVKLRQAIAYAIDKERIIEGVSFGLGAVHDQKVQKTSRWYVPGRERERDLNKARALLKEAGYPNGLKVKVRVSKLWPNMQVMQVVQSQLREAGIQIDLEIIDWAKSQEGKRTGDFEFEPLGGATYLDPDLAYYQYFHTEKTPIKVSNFPRYSNPKLDKLLEDGRKELDPKKRYQIYKDAIEIINEDVPQITVGFNPYLFAHRKNVRAFELQEQNDDYYYVVGGLGWTWMDK